MNTEQLILMIVKTPVVLRNVVDRHMTDNDIPGIVQDAKIGDYSRDLSMIRIDYLTFDGSWGRMDITADELLEWVLEEVNDSYVDLRSN